MPKFERTKPHVSVGTIGFNSRQHHRSSLLRAVALQATLANVASDTTSPVLYGNESTGPKTYTNMNQGPMEDPRNREERRLKSKNKHGLQTGSKYKRRKWWE